ncbi:MULTISPECIES: cytochrome P450 [Streptomyces]|uniref:Cytochrome P450 n=1 Tax=Streptomyces thermoviolaceus subsp. thermoviolaceus TaxID=66860 RepID=A0ABX0YV41_STRTL|nr:MULTISPECIES: cytochrome P450 [Streptomyces]WTD50569.1 cytochrome P450 [Streptomyces thermoviolaceus]NJP16303.1 cytochrome P450 [Streptomyces thermoviolaceus subsp. thermoviolaceus]RSS08149.1 cytochrome P450 [Streptomyces sp. WAC00469]GGV82425.1 cytochrome P450 [Streptomyces thermoviolaceus subsp. apingens]GHB07406.1 cytochrome P450 [Streptomyces thermoviolaceus subsp. thermoviolaceus]
MSTAPLPPLPTRPPAGCPFDPPEGLDRLRIEEPLSKVALDDGSWAWLATRWADVRAILGDSRFSSDTNTPGYPISGMTGGGPRPGATRGFIRMDPPEHTRLRRMVTRDFMVKRVEELRPTLQRLTDELCDAMERLDRSEHPVDLVKALALPLPSLAISLLLGVPYADHETFQRLTGALLSRNISEEDRGAARTELLAYIDGLVESKKAEPGDDILSRLVTERYAQGELTHEDLVAFAVLLLVAGHETTANMIGLSALTLMLDQDTAGRLRENPSLIRGAVEELLRFHSIIRNGPRRAALEDVEVGGQLIRKGEGVIVAVPSANRDEDVFPDAGRLDICRPNAQHHVAFGYGIHQCLGQALARAELQVVITTLLRRFPTMRPAVPLEEIPFRTDMVIYGCHSLPVTW